ncbi:hypothetical protein ACFL34_04555 [Candidatus Sumerlaeota bacterium]
MEQLGIDDTAKYEVLMKRMDAIGALALMSGTNMCAATTINPGPHARDILHEARAYQKAEGAAPDIIDQMRDRARRNPVIAGVIIVVLVLAIVIPLVNSAWELIEKVLKVVK